MSWQGRLLCSSRDPGAEATKWAEQQSFKNEDTVLVLGLGAGHHLQALRVLRPTQKFIVLDYHQALIEKFVVEALVDNCQLIHVSENSKDIVKAMVKASLPVLFFRQATSGLEKEYENLRKDLIGANQQSLALQSQAKGCYHLSQLLTEKSADSFTDFLSIKDIDHLMVDHKENKEAKIWQVLRELVK